MEQVPAVPNPEQQPTTERPKGNPVVALMVIVMVLLLGAVGFLGYQNYLLQQKINKMVQPTSTPSATPDPTADWKTYTNNALGVSLKSPFGEPLETINSFQDYKNGAMTLTGKFIFDVSNLKVCEGSAPYQTMCIVPGKNWSQSKDVESIVLATKEAVSFFVSEPTANLVIHVIQIQQPKIELALAVDGVGQEEKFDLILSTFKFTEITNQSCPTGFTKFDDNFFSFCQPSDMTYSKRAHGTTEDPNKSAETVTFENATEKIVISTSFTGGWGGGYCLTENRTIGQETSTILIWDKEGNTKTCSSNLIDLVAVVGSANRGGNLAIAIDYQQKGTQFLDRSKFNEVIDSFEPK